ncbi:hypothetical protein MACH09_32670 [Vibrio sp. MACH09]|nr:hypothetical protein MACH09_32670 [Vibrio sp. MACH09]
MLIIAVKIGNAIKFRCAKAAHYYPVKAGINAPMYLNAGFLIPTLDFASAS